MPRIYVDPEELDIVARSMLDSADEVERCGRELLAVATAAPSYDGQYGPWLEAMATEDDHDTRLLAEEIRERANELLGIAVAFRDADFLDGLGHAGWAMAIRRMVDAGYHPSGLVADWHHSLGRPPQITQEEWDRLTEERKRAYLEGAWDSQWLWAHPGALAFALTEDRAGREYLMTTALPQLRNSPTGRAVIEALLDQAPVRVIVAPNVIENPQAWLRDHGLEWLGDRLSQLGITGLPANLQPAFTHIIMVNENQSGHVFAHEAVHLLARATGVDSATFVGEWEVRRERPWPGDAWWRILGDEVQLHQLRPGFSLAMEREAMVVDHTIQIEAPLPNTDVGKLRTELQALAGYDASAALDMIKTMFPGAYDSFPTGNEPPRYWRADLRDLGLEPEVIRAIESAAQLPSPPAGPR